jgi:hypothetical protein
MNNKISIITIFLITIIAISTLLYQNNEYKECQNNLVTVNNVRIRAENKPCCQLIQERYNEKRISEEGTFFIYTEHPQIINCE